MAYALINSVQGSGSPSSDDTFTTAAIDTTGADLLIANVVQFEGTTATLSDSKGNTWVGLTAKVAIGQTRLFYCASPTVGSGHTFTLTGTSIWGLLQVQAWSGAHATPFGQQNGSFNSVATSRQPGSVTPAEDGELIIAGLAGELNTHGAFSINSGFTISNQSDFGNPFNTPGAMAYLVQTVATPVNPTWSWTNSRNGAATIATFKAAPPPVDPPDQLVYALSAVDSRWYSRQDDAWVDEGLRDPEFPAETADGFEVPTDGPAIVDVAGREWELDGQTVMVDGEPFHGGWADKLYKHDGEVWHHNPGTPSLGWITFNFTTGVWNNPVNPAPWEAVETESVHGFTIPTSGSEIIDSLLDNWTISSGQLRKNAVQYLAAVATQARYWDHVVYHYTGTHWRKENPPGSWAVVTPPWENVALWSTTGSINAGSKILTVTNPSIFVVNDYVIVPVGFEAGAGQRGTMGVGGTQPHHSRRYATTALLTAATPSQGFYWAADTGDVWGYQTMANPDGWFLWRNFYRGEYYLSKAQPLALIGKIDAINGNQLTLSNPWFGQSGGFAQADVPAGTPVYKDATRYIQAFVESLASGTVGNPTIGNLNTQFPGVTALPSAGSMFLGAKFDAPSNTYVKDTTRKHIRLCANGKDQMRVFAPAGTPGAQFTMFNDGIEHRDYTIHDNFGDHGYCLNMAGSTPPAQTGWNNSIQQSGNNPSINGYWKISLRYMSCLGGDIRDMDFLETGWAVMLNGCSNINGTRLRAIHSFRFRGYLQWMFNGYQCDNCQWIDPDVQCASALTAGPEWFQSSGCKIIRPKGLNAMLSMNNCGGGFRVGSDAANRSLGGGELRFTKNCQKNLALNFDGTPFDNFGFIEFTENAKAIISINNSAGWNMTYSGGTVQDVRIIQEDYVNDDAGEKRSLTGIGIGEGYTWNGYTDQNNGQVHPAAKVYVHDNYIQLKDKVAGTNGHCCQISSMAVGGSDIHRNECIGAGEPNTLYPNIINYDGTSAMTSDNTAAIVISGWGASPPWSWG